MHWRRSAGRGLGCGLAAAMLFAATAATGEPLAATMRKVMAGLAAVLPMAFDEDRTPAERERFERKLAELSEAAKGVDAHARRRDAGFGFLSGSLSKDLAAVRESWERGEEEAASYYLIQATSNCVACHSRLPGDHLISLSSEIERVIDEDAESVHEKAQLLVATRQFDRALAAWEGLFADPEFPPAQTDVGGYLLDYLTIAIRVRNDHERARTHLSRLAARADAPRYLKRLLGRWSAQLAELGGRERPADLVVAARELIESATASSSFATGRERLVSDLQASAWLLQYIDSAKPSDPSIAEAFYLLGLVEARSVDGYWVPQTDAHLEAAVRAAPGGPFAERAYELLEEYWALSYGGITDPHLPPDYTKRLESLQDLMSAAAEPAAPGGSK